MLLAVLRDDDNLGCQILNRYRINYKLIKEMLEYQLTGQEPSMDSSDTDDDDKNFGGGGFSGQRTDTKSGEKSRTPILDNFGRDLTKMAEIGKLDPIVGREKEIERVAQILSRRKRTILY